MTALVVLREKVIGPSLPPANGQRSPAPGSVWNAGRILWLKAIQAPRLFPYF
jgi:hypothetical protein